VLQSLDTLGAGFQLASHDLDIRGAGNLLGEEQSGQIKEVGFELYQQMLEEAVASLKAGGDEESRRALVAADHRRHAGDDPGDLCAGSAAAHVALPPARRPRRRGEIDAFGAELIDRFGPLPDEVDHLLKVVFVKSLCRRANVEKVDAGPKGVVIAFRNNEFANGAGLVRYLGEQGSMAKLRPDQKVVFIRDWPTGIDRLKAPPAYSPASSGSPKRRRPPPEGFCH
jgi:transcription-repair coupling factor (superfamily II helicase)